MSENQDEKLLKIRHSFAHIMAQAVEELYGKVKFGIGPAIESGFYYDFELDKKLTLEDLDDISNKMKEIVKSGIEFKKEILTREKAVELFKNQPYKLELIYDLSDDAEISVYRQGSFFDLCKGPHIDDYRKLNLQAFKLLNIAGSYWRGDEKNPMLQRIYGTAWTNPKDLAIYMNRLAEAEKRDHRKLGKQLDLFSLHEEAGPGLVYWHPKGAKVRVLIENFWREEHYKNGYEMVFTPHIGKAWLWETSGHLDFYQESMYPPMVLDNFDYYTKPMNCPFHIMIYNNGKHSYRDLPCRWAELGTVYRFEKAGALHGLLRVRGFTQDDAHIICTPNQIEDEILKVLKFSLYMLKSFGFDDIKAYISTKPEKSVGKIEDWDLATKSLIKAVGIEQLEYQVDEGGGAFYGPKIDLKIKDALGREWQLSTVQFDFNLPERFKMSFTDSDGVEKRPFVVHRALLGSIERFFGVLLEHFAGAFPVWLAPVQIVIIPVSQPFYDYSVEVLNKLKEVGFRVEFDDSDERLNAKIRLAQTKKIPYMLIIGEKEVSAKNISIRYRDGKQIGGVSLSDFISEVNKVVALKNSEV